MSYSINIYYSLNNNSFERFGDDLTELILSHLTVEDKFRYECVSKQWKNLIFNKEFELKVNNCSNTKQITNKGLVGKKIFDNLEIILAKLKYIKDIDLKFSQSQWDSDLKTITKIFDWMKIYCVYLDKFNIDTEYIDLGSNEDIKNQFIKSIEAFFEQKGKRLKNFKFKSNILSPETLSQLLSKLQNIRALSFRDISVFNGNIYKYLTEIQFQKFSFPELKTLTDRYHTQIRTIKINSGFEQEINQVFEQLSRFEKLGKLEFITFFNNNAINIPIDESLFHRNTSKMTQLTHFYYEGLPFNCNLFGVFSQMTNLKSLSISLMNPNFKTVDLGSMSNLSELKKLEYFSLKMKNRIEIDLTGIDQHLSQLKYLSMKNSSTSVESIYDLSNLKNLISLELSEPLPSDTQTAIIDLIKKRENLKTLRLDTFCMSRKVIDAFIENAYKNEKTIYTFMRCLDNERSSRLNDGHFFVILNRPKNMIFVENNSSKTPLRTDFQSYICLEMEKLKHNMPSIIFYMLCSLLIYIIMSCEQSN